jgi:Tol biopolymer transport system component
MINNEQLVSSNASGTEGNDNSFDPSISADGSKVAFVSLASNFVNGSPNFIREIYVKNLTTRAVTLVSQTGTTIANDTCLDPAISADGNSVVFESVATNLGSTSGVAEIYVKNLQSGALTLVSSSSTKVAANGSSFQAAISANGNMVAFQSGANNLLANVSGSQIYIKNVQTGAVTLVSQTANKTVGNDLSKSPSISDDGTKVAFTSDSINLVAGATAGNDEIYRKDTSTPTGALILVSQTKGGVVANGSNEMPSISADGNTIAFQSTATNLAAGTSGLLDQIYVKNVQTGDLTLASETADGKIANGDCSNESLSADGRYVVFRSFATNLVAGVSGPQVYLKDLNTGALSLLSANADGAQASNDSDADRAGSGRLISGDDATFVFDSAATNLLSTGPTDHEQVFSDKPTVGLQGVDYRVRTGTATTGMDLPAIAKYNGGVKFVATYIGATNDVGYLRAIPDGQLFADQGLSIVSVYERSPTDASYFTVANADYDASRSILAAREAGQGPTSAIYFTIDFDPTSTDLSAIDNYFRKIRADFNASGDQHKIGVYGPGSALSMLVNDPLVKPDYTWLALKAWGREGFTGENIDQTFDSINGNKLIIGNSVQAVDVDTAVSQDFGQWSGSSAVPAQPAVVDFNGDGASDILLQNTDGATQMWLMNGVSAASTAALGNPGAAWHAAATGDFNQDGNADILWQNADGQAGIWEMNGSSFTGSAGLGNAGSSWHIIATGDFNADGNADILWQNTSGLTGVWEMNGTSLKSSGPLGNPGASWHAIGTGDFNGDGKSDILWQNTDGLTGIWEMNGLSLLASGPLGNPGSSWHAIGTGDFNGDGKSDILWQNTDGLTGIWEMNGLSLIASGSLSNPGASWHAIGTSDFNGDGKADIIWQNTDGLPGIWEMNGFSLIASGPLTNLGASWQVKDDGPIPAPAPTALKLSAPDVAGVSATPLLSDPTASNTSGTLRPFAVC